MRNSASIAGIWLRVSRVKNCRHPQKIRLAQQLIAAGELTPSLLKNLSLTSAQVEQFLNYPQAELNRTESWLADQNHHFVTIVDLEYPAQLKSCFGAPLFLFVCGNIHCLNRVQLAVVGSRISSVYGQQWCYEFSSRLSQSGLLITSGLASGIDSIAHQAALDSENSTLAVQGCGINYIYPRQHRALYQRIIESDGAVVSEFPPDIPPKAINFPRRNRIISGLSVGTLVIEASLRSGSLITAQHALDQNRNVYALPGPLGKPESEGCHWLIQQGALLVVRPEDLLEDLATGYRSLKFDVSEQINSSQTATVALPFADVLANVGDEVTPVDVVAERAGRSVPEIAAALLELELAGWIAAVPGGYVRLRRACHVRRSYVLV